MKLELKHLAPYLPYELDIYDIGTSRIISKLSVVNIEFTSRHFSNNSLIKPILRPLSDLTKEIEVNGEKFVPTKWFVENCSNFSISKEDMEKLIKMVLYIFTSPSSAPYWFIEKLFEWHIDVLGLIEKGLAVDLNTLNK